MEDDVGSLKEQQKKLEERAKELELRIMEELKCQNAETRNEISRLESVIGFLERKLEQVTQKPLQDVPKEETAMETLTSEQACSTPEASSEASEKTLQEYVAPPMYSDNVSEAPEEADLELEQRDGKKKHKFF